MIKPEQVPTGVVAVFDAVWEMTRSTDKAIAAALNAWPGMHTHEWQRPWLGGMSGTDLILPLPPPPAGETNEF